MSDWLKLYFMLMLYPLEMLLIIILFPAVYCGDPLAGVPRGRSIPLAKGGVNTSPAERGPHKIFDFVGFIEGRVSA